MWAYDPVAEQLYAFLESDGPATVDNPDNITVSPRGGILLCEDGNAGQYMIGVTQDGEATFRFARNTVVLNGSRNGITGDFVNAEFAGATWDPSGEVLFCNIQTPGITFAIWGPWHRGAL
ncbi:MAG: alkaline phosphatase PhoX [Myxococcota bacterium]